MNAADVTEAKRPNSGSTCSSEGERLAVLLAVALDGGIKVDELAALISRSPKTSASPSVPDSLAHHVWRR